MDDKNDGFFPFLIALCTLTLTAVSMWGYFSLFGAGNVSMVFSVFCAIIFFMISFYVSNEFVEFVIDKPWEHAIYMKQCKNEEKQRIENVRSFFKKEKMKLEDVLFLKKKRQEDISLREWDRLLKERNRKLLLGIQDEKKEEQLCPCCQEIYLFYDYDNFLKKACSCPSVQVLREKEWL